MLSGRQEHKEWGRVKGKRKVGKERRRGERDREERRGEGGNKEVGGRSRERRKE